jgi:hypothetical protein
MWQHNLVKQIGLCSLPGRSPTTALGFRNLPAQDFLLGRFACDLNSTFDIRGTAA